MYFYPIKGCVGGVLGWVFELRTPASIGRGVCSILAQDTRGNVRSNSGSGVICKLWRKGRLPSLTPQPTNLQSETSRSCRSWPPPKLGVVPRVPEVVTLGARPALHFWVGGALFPSFLS